MALDLKQIATVLESFRAIDDPEVRAGFLDAAQQVMEALQESLPALCETDQAAVAFYIAGVFASLREMPLSRASDVIRDTSVGYSLTTAILLGIDVGNPE